MSALKRFTLAASALAVAGLAGCGGGGGAGSEASVNTFPVEAVFVSASTGGLSLNGSAVDGTDTWTISMTISPAADQVFEGVTVKQAVVAMTVKKNGVTALATSGQSFFTINPYAPKGLLLADGSYGVQTVAASVVPVSASVGGSGALGKITVYPDAGKASTLFTQEATWTLETDSASTAFLCTNTAAKDNSNQTISTTAGCYKINSAGTVVGMRWTVAVAGKTLTFR